MSNTLAIATVTATLQQLILNSISQDFPGATVTIGEPQAPSPTPTPQVNICMYQLSPNLGYRNYDLPAKDEAGNWLNQPTLGIDLHYLFTFYGNDQKLEPQRLLGDVISTLYTQPVLTASLIEQTISLPLYSYLAESDLADSVEQVKLIPQADPKEEVARLWRDYFQTIPYSLSLAYQASVVLITTEETLKPELPVEVVVINTSVVPVPASSHIPLPPLHKASALDLSLLQVTNDSTIIGTIKIGKANDESDIEQYRLYWSIDGKIKLNSAIKILSKTGNDLIFTLPAPLPIATGAEYLLVLTSNYNAEMTYGIASPLSLINIASGLTLDLTKAGDNLIGGSITIFKALNESELTSYHIYWGSDATTKLSNSPIIAAVDKTGDNIIYPFNPAIAQPPDAKYILVFAAVGTSEMVYGVSAGIPPFNTATGLTLDLMGLPGSEVAGTISVQRATDESDLTQYNVYWGSDATTKLVNTPVIAKLSKNSDLTYTLPNNATLPSDANYVLAFTANPQAEMTHSVNAAIPPLYTAVDATVNLSVNTDGTVSGSVNIIRALDETTLTQYRLYWSADGVSKLLTEPLGILNKNGLNQSYPLTSIILPNTAAYVLVLTANSTAEMSHGVSAGIPPVDIATGVELALTKADNNRVGGTITVLRALNESNLTAYNVYWSNDGTDKLALITKQNKTGSNIAIDLSPPVSKPANAYYVLVLTENVSIEMSTGVHVGVPPLNMATNVTDDLNLNTDGTLSGTITVGRALDESDLSDYNLYWSNDGQNKATGNALIATLSKSSDLIYTTPTSLVWPTDANYILALTKNAQAEMKQGVSVMLQSMSRASGVTLNNMVMDNDNLVSGNINILRAQNENSITQYLIYWSVDGINPLPDVNQPIAVLPKTESVNYALPPSKLPDGAAYILVLTGNNTTIMSTGVSAIIPPLTMAVGVMLNLTKTGNNQLSGNITIKRAQNENTISEYIIFWSADGTTPLTDPNNLIVTLSKTENLDYFLPITTLPTNANYILVLTGNSSGTMTTGVSSAFAPTHKASAVQLNLAKSAGNNVSGTITIVKANDESDITRYNLYWGADNNTKLTGTPFASPAKSNNNIVVSLSPPIPRPTGSNYVLSFSENSLAEMNSNTGAGIPPLNRALALTLAVNKDTNNQLTGTMTITKSADESDISYYSLYWGINASTILANTPAFKSFPKTGNDLIYNITSNDNLIVPKTVTYVIAITGNAQAEMSSGVSSVLP